VLREHLATYWLAPPTAPAPACRASPSARYHGVFAPSTVPPTHRSSIKPIAVAKNQNLSG